MLARLLAATPARDEVRVLSLTTDGPIGERIRALGVQTDALGLRRGLPSPALVTRCARALREWRPAVLQTWMYHSDLVGGLAARAAGDIKVAWGIRNNFLDSRTSRLGTRLVRRACALLSSRLPDAIVSCSAAAARHHVALGYARDRMCVIPNGFDLGRFSPSAEARAAIRAELSIPEATMVVGMAARFDADKDYPNLLRAAGRVIRQRTDVLFVLCGGGVDSTNGELQRLVAEAGAAGRVRCLGQRADLHRVMASWDLAVLSSRTEAFPNVLGEAMACGVPCVATDVGDSATIVGDTGRLVPPQDDGALAGGILELLALPAAARAELGARARDRIVAEYDIARIAARYDALYRRLVAGERPARKA
jgi:glycosyltransferase involved in cell wall biosynthesis